MIVERQLVQLHNVTKEYAPQYPILPLDVVRKTFQQKRVDWEASNPGQELFQRLGSVKIPTIKKIIALACFNMSDCEMADRSAGQHALVPILRTFFARHQDMDEDDILCFAQDPLYEDADKAVLAEAGISVLENPVAFLEVDDASLVFSLSPETPVRQIVADIALPAVMIWDRVEEFRQDPDWVGHTEL